MTVFNTKPGVNLFFPPSNLGEDNSTSSGFSLRITDIFSESGNISDFGFLCQLQCHGGFESVLLPSSSALAFSSPPFCSRCSLPSDVTLQPRHVNRNLHANTVHSVTGGFHIFFNLMLEHTETDFFTFTGSVYNRSEACTALLNSWTPVYITNEPLDSYTVIC